MARKPVSKKRKNDEPLQHILTPPASPKKSVNRAECHEKNDQEEVQLPQEPQPVPIEGQNDEPLQHILTPPASPKKSVNWTECHEMNDQEEVQLPQEPQPVPIEASENTRNENLITRQALNELWRSNRTEEVFAECDKICAFLMQTSKSIIHVYPTYGGKNKDNVEFVVLTNKKLRRPKNIKYALDIRKVKECSGESIAIMRSEKYRRNKYRLNPKKAKVIREIINEKAKELMSDHKYLSVITGSGIRSKNYGGKVHLIKSEPCIAMYVCIKGKIPLAEEELPKELNGIPVDVREGFFQNSTSTADKFQKKLRLGCQITSNANANVCGTLGGFVDRKEYDLCGITCAHVVLNERELYDHMSVKRKTWEDGNRYIYQPAKVRLRNCVGSLKETVFNSGNKDREAGVDLALFKIEDRHPDSGEFSETNENVRYDTGRFVRESQMNLYNRKVLKYGQTTGRTDGYIEFFDTALKRIKFSPKSTVESNDFDYILLDQLEIRPDFAHDRFSDAGDSGALVFSETVNKELACVGMIVGNLTFNDGTTRRGNSIVTPVSAIMDTLGISELKSFVWNRIDSMKKSISTIDRLDSMEKSISSIDRRLGLLEDMDTRMKNIEKMLQAKR